MRILFLGDIVGQPGVAFLKRALPVVAARGNRPGHRQRRECLGRLGHDAAPTGKSARPAWTW